MGLYYAVAEPSQLLVVSGYGIKDIKVCQKHFTVPGQRVIRFSMTPVNYTLSLSAMSTEKLEFTLPVVFTIGPADKPEALYKYAKLLAATATKTPNHLEELVRGIIEGEMRVIAAGLTIEEIFKDRKPVKDQIMHSVQTELDQFGLLIFNANIKQLQDSPGSEYFQYMRLKTHEGAVNQAKVEVAQARYLGDVGEAQRKGLTRQENSKIEAQAVIFENQRKAEMAGAQTTLSLQTTEYDLKVELAKIEKAKATELRGHELQREIETKKALAEEERLRATELAKAKIDAEAVIAKADADLYRVKREAEANLYTAQKEAEAIKTKFEAQAAGLKAVSNAFDGNTSAMIQYIMIEKGIYQDLAKANADAVRGLQPKMNIWTTGPSGSDGAAAGDPLASIRNMQSLVPLVSGINDMTGINPPAWMGSLPPASVTGAAAPNGAVDVKALAKMASTSSSRPIAA